MASKSVIKIIEMSAWYRFVHREYEKKEIETYWCLCPVTMGSALYTGFAVFRNLKLLLIQSKRARVVNLRSLARQDSKQNNETKYTSFSSLVALPSKKDSRPFPAEPLLQLQNFQPFLLLIFSNLNSFESNAPSPNFSTCSLIPIKSIKCLQAFSIVLCLSMLNG